MTENTIFYSKHCKHCKDFILKLKDRDLLKMFTKRICIDKVNNLPPFLKEVPTIIVDDYDKPLAGDYAFKWIEFKNKKVVEKEAESSGLMPFDFNNSFSSFGGIEGSEQFGGLNSESHSLLESLGDPLLDKGLQQQASASNDSTDMNKRLDRITSMRSMDDELNGANGNRR